MNLYRTIVGATDMGEYSLADLAIMNATDTPAVSRG